MQYSLDPHKAGLLYVSKKGSDDKMRICLNVDKDYLNLTNVRVKFHNSLQLMLGYLKHIGVDLGWHDWPSPRPNTVKQLEWVAIGSFDVHRASLRSVCVFCDIIEPSIVGSDQLPLLQMLPIDVESHQVASGFFSSLSFCRVNSGRISKIRIWITESLDSNPIIFTDDVYITLYFEPII